MKHEDKKWKLEVLAPDCVQGPEWKPDRKPNGPATATRAE